MVIQGSYSLWSVLLHPCLHAKGPRKTVHFPQEPETDT